MEIRKGAPTPSESVPTQSIHSENAHFAELPTHQVTSKKKQIKNEPPEVMVIPAKPYIPVGTIVSHQMPIPEVYAIPYSSSIPVTPIFPKSDSVSLISTSILPSTMCCIQCVFPVLD